VARVIRGIGWLMVVSGSIVLLYVVYLMWFTNLGTDQAQREFAESWEAEVQSRAEAAERSEDEGEGDDEDLDPGSAFAMLWFERDGDPIVTDDPYFVVHGVTLDDLRAGPGYYPESERPGGDGNFAIAGHRTTYGAPFWSLDELQDGDTIHVVDRDGEEWVYEFTEQRVVAPSDTWVVGEDPIDTGAPTITLTTCHPRFSAAQRLIVWGELVA
jgi:sortase A